jgi:GNAT superfamily N-acetyltransferase
MPPTTRALTSADRDDAVEVINAAARWYRDFLPVDELHDPEMTPAQWTIESRRMTWHGAFVGGRLVGVVGLEYTKDVALMRHAYVRPDHQRFGIGSALLDAVEASVDGVRRIIAGTYRDNHKARGLLEKRGFQPSVDSESVLRTYYAIPEDRLLSSVTYEKVIRTA